MKIYNYPSTAAEHMLNTITGRGLSYTKNHYNTVERILKDVRQQGDDALIQYTHQFDSKAVTAGNLKVTDIEFENAIQTVDADFTKALERATQQISSFHQQQKQNSWIDTERDGVILGRLIRPVDAAGIYVPGARGGTTPLVSSVLMTAIPAKIAGVKHIAMMTPPMENGRINPHLLAAAHAVGVDRVYKAGGAWAIAALAYGTQTVRKVDVIAGPGNIYVTLAKKMVAGTVGIDMIAGPSEILVIADDSADPEYAAADLLSQAEHDPMASAILVTPCPELAGKIVRAVANQLQALPRKDIAQTSLDRFSAIFVVRTLKEAFDLSNRIAPEHLELMIQEPFHFLNQIRNAGAVFMGHHTPEPMGDYMAGPNHVLPTAGTARFTSALSVDNFIKKTSLIHYSREAFQKEAPDVIQLAGIEGLEAHAYSVKIRLK
jgi:histidinol dehydrogenase